MIAFFLNPSFYEGEHCVSLLCLWRDSVCVEQPEAAAREAKVILVALVKLLWRWSSGQTAEIITKEVTKNKVDKTTSCEPC